MILRYTSKASVVYAILLDWPLTEDMLLGAPNCTQSTQVTMLGYEGKFTWKPLAAGSSGMRVSLPSIPVNKLPSKWAWVFKLENVV